MTELETMRAKVAAYESLQRVRGLRKRQRELMNDGDALSAALRVMREAEDISTVDHDAVDHGLRFVGDRIDARLLAIEEELRTLRVYNTNGEQMTKTGKAIEKELGLRLKITKVHVGHDYEWHGLTGRLYGWSAGSRRDAREAALQALAEMRQ